MNQAIQFPDREEWRTDISAVVFPALVHGMQLTCAISGETLASRFGGCTSEQLLGNLSTASLGPGRRGRSIDPGPAGRLSGLGLVTLI